jgi:hypothetical protein
MNVDFHAKANPPEGDAHRATFGARNAATIRSPMANAPYEARERRATDVAGYAETTAANG